MISVLEFVSVDPSNEGKGHMKREREIERKEGERYAGRQGREAKALKARVQQIEGQGKDCGTLTFVAVDTQVVSLNMLERQQGNRRG